MNIKGILEVKINDINQLFSKFIGKKVVYNFRKDKFKIGTILSVEVYFNIEGNSEIAFTVQPEAKYIANRDIVWERFAQDCSEELYLKHFKGPFNSINSWALLGSKCANDWMNRAQKYYDKHRIKDIKDESKLPEGPEYLKDSDKEIYLEVLRHKMYNNSIYIIPRRGGKHSDRAVVEIPSSCYQISIEKDNFYICIDHCNALYATHIKGSNINKKYFYNSVAAEDFIEKEKKIKKGK